MVRKVFEELKMHGARHRLEASFGPVLELTLILVGKYWMFEISTIPVRLWLLLQNYNGTPFKLVCGKIDNIKRFHLIWENRAK